MAGHLASAVSGRRRDLGCESDSHRVTGPIMCRVVEARRAGEALALGDAKALAQPPAPAEILGLSALPP